MVGRVSRDRQLVNATRSRKVVHGAKINTGNGTLKFNHDISAALRHFFSFFLQQ